jgi:Uma2 family endonuclease
MEVSLDLNKRYTYADCLSCPEGYRCEIINGVVRELPPVYTAHGKVCGNLMLLLGSCIKNVGRKCKIFGGIFDVRFPKRRETTDDKIDTVVQPDICVICDLSKIDERGCCGAPDMIVEILSPSTYKKDVTEKFALYEEQGVKEYWMVHPEAKAIDVFVLQEDGKYDKGTLYEWGGKVPVHVFDGATIDMEDVFEK